MPYENIRSIEIAAPPAKVREILLNFRNYPYWHYGFMERIEIQDKNKTPQTLAEGDKIEVTMQKFKFIAEIEANTEELFSWQGPPVFTIAGLHKFHFEPIKDGTA